MTVNSERVTFAAMDKESQKETIEGLLDEALAAHANLTNRHKMILAQAISCAFRGLFVLSKNIIDQIDLPETNWATPVEDEAVAEINRQMLTHALRDLKSSAAQTPAVFR